MFVIYLIGENAVVHLRGTKEATYFEAKQLKERGYKIVNKKTWEAKLKEIKQQKS